MEKTAAIDDQFNAMMALEFPQESPAQEVISMESPITLDEIDNFVAQLNGDQALEPEEQTFMDQHGMTTRPMTAEELAVIEANESRARFAAMANFMMQQLFFGEEVSEDAPSGRKRSRALVNA